jgi:hypothetical protein
MNLVAVPVTRLERHIGLLIHLRRADAPPEESPRRCRVCGTRIIGFNKQQRNAKFCTLHGRAVRKGIVTFEEMEIN